MSKEPYIPLKETYIFSKEPYVCPIICIYIYIPAPLMEGQRFLGFVNSSVSFVKEILLCGFFFFDVLLFGWVVLHLSGGSNTQE